MSEIKFKSTKKRPIRKRRSSSDDSDNSSDEKPTTDEASVADIKEMQKMRKRGRGVNIEDLDHVKEVKEKKEETDDPFKTKTGGFVDMKTIKKSRITAEDLEAIGTSFAAETNRRDEDADMVKYVEKELARRKGIVEDNISPTKAKDAEDLLYELPESIKKIVKEKNKSEELLSNQMLSGIPEVDLGIQSKIRNIEATEEAKQKLLEEKRNRKEQGLVDFVPTNMAVNFVQHNRFSRDDIASSAPKKKAEEAPKVEPVRVGDVRPPTADLYKSGNDKPGEKSTDDFHYEKFKRQMRR